MSKENYYTVHDPVRASDYAEWGLMLAETLANAVQYTAEMKAAYKTASNPTRRMLVTWYPYSLVRAIFDPESEVLKLQSPLYGSCPIVDVGDYIMPSWYGMSFVVVKEDVFNTMVAELKGREDDLREQLDIIKGKLKILGEVV